MSNYRPGLAEVVPPEDTAPPFRATTYALEINVAVDVSEEVSDRFGDRGHIPVLGLLGGTGIRATLVPAGGGRRRLFLNEEMREATGTEVGEEVELLLWGDTTPRAPERRASPSR